MSGKSGRKSKSRYRKVFTSSAPKPPAAKACESCGELTDERCERCRLAFCPRCLEDGRCLSCAIDPNDPSDA